MAKTQGRSGLLNKTVHPRVAALLLLFVVVGSQLGIAQLEANITAHYDEINQIAEIKPNFPSPGTIAGVRTDTSVGEQVPVQPAEEYLDTHADTPPAATPTPQAISPAPSSPQNTQEPSRKNPQAADPASKPTPARPGPLLCVIGVCL